MCDSSGAVLLVPPCPPPGGPPPSGACAGAVLLASPAPAARAAAGRAAAAGGGTAETAASSAADAATAGAADAATAAVGGGWVDVAGMVAALAGMSTDLPDAARVDRIRELEELKAAAAAAQARVTAAFVGFRRAERIAAGVKPERVEHGIAAEVALAKRESPHRAHRYVGFARVLTTELPCTFAALQSGATTEARAFTLARETIWLPRREDRATVDAALGPRLESLGDREVEQETRTLAYRLDPAGYVNRSRAAAHDRRVTLRPAPDTMTRLTALLPAAQGVAAYAALHHAAQTARATGDPRGRGQVMADTLVTRVTGQDTPHGVPVEITLVMTDHTLHGHHTTGTDHGQPATTDRGQADQADPAGAAAEEAADRSDHATNPGPGRWGSRADEPAVLLGYGPIPAGIARDLLLDTPAGVWLRRVYTHPATGELVAMDNQRRVFDGPLRHALIVRDQYCRTPWCAAPIRHGDHVLRAADGGPTSLGNGQGLCEACNYLKEAAGWGSRPGPDGAGHSVIITTPTGHTYTSRPPGLPGAKRTTIEPLHGLPPEQERESTPADVNTRAGPSRPEVSPPHRRVTEPDKHAA